CHARFRLLAQSAPYTARSRQWLGHRALPDEAHYAYLRAGDASPGLVHQRIWRRRYGIKSGPRHTAIGLLFQSGSMERCTAIREYDRWVAWGDKGGASALTRHVRR